MSKQTTKPALYGVTDTGYGQHGPRTHSVYEARIAAKLLSSKDAHNGRDNGIKMVCEYTEPEDSGSFILVPVSIFVNGVEYSRQDT